MRAIGAVIGWLGRRAVLYLLLVAALIAAASLLPWLQSEWVRPNDAQTRIARLEPVRAEVARATAAGRQALDRRMREAGGQSVQWIDARLLAVRRDLAKLERTQASRAQTLLHLARGDAAAVLRDQRHTLAILLRRREIAALDRARAEAELARFGNLRGQARAADTLRRQCATARTRVTEFDRQWIGRRILDLSARARLADTATAVCADADRTAASVRLRLEAQRAAIVVRRQARAASARAAATLDAEARAVTAALDHQLARDRAVVSASLRGWAERIDLAGKARLAAWLLLAGILLPYAIRTLCYFVLAPIAARRPPIQLRVPGGEGTAVLQAERSTTSVGVRLNAGEELLVRQDYLQSSSGVGHKATRWLLDPRHPLTSIAAGLVFLTRIRGEGEVTTISAVRDPFAEVTVLTLPEGAACVLHPRALAAVAQPFDRPLTITRHWRLTTLNAWLTLQLRYLVFHGPARLVIKGARGVRVERAEHGRIFGQEQLAGFSAELTYSVTRTETFWPYLFGRESLLKDRVIGGDGVLIVEEAPFVGRGGRGARKGLEGALDAMLKAVGI